MIGCLVLLTGCSKDPQAGPHNVVRGIALLSGTKKGFFVTNGKPTYHDWNTGAGNIVVPLEGADAESFQSFEQPKNARALFAHDDRHVYMADFYTPREIEGADGSSFELITLDGHFAKDAQRVYFHGVPIVDADPLTFEVLIFPFSQDKEHAFIGATPIPEVDRRSWRPLHAGRTGDYWYRSPKDIHPNKQEAVGVWGWSRDVDAFYFGRDRVLGIDVDTFEVLSAYYAKDAQNVYSYHRLKLAVIEEADPATFVIHQDVDDTLRPWGPDAHDANSQFQGGKVFKRK